MLRKVPFNLVWSKLSDPGDKEGVLFRVEVNVAESGFVSPGSYSVEVKGNKIYWPIEGEDK